MSPMLELRDARFAYGEACVLDGVDLRIEQGERVALLGANGSGKTTALRLLSGALRPIGGRVLLEGRDVAAYGRRALARTVAVLPQEQHVPRSWTVRNIVALGRTPYVPWLGGATPEDVAAVHRAMEQTDTMRLAERELATLSGGQGQRVSMALALAQSPRVLLLDEPTAHLDLRYKAELLDAVTDLGERLGLTVLAAMHEPSLAALYFPRLVLLHAGRVLADGAPDEVLTEPLLERAYGAPVRVTHDPALGVPVVSILPARMRATSVGVRHSTEAAPTVRRGP